MVEIINIICFNIASMKKTIFLFEAIVNSIIIAFFLLIYFTAGYIEGDSLFININNFLYKWYWCFAGGIILLLIADFIYTICCYYHGRESFVIKVCDKIFKFGFLFRQLVARDFKAKYKRSVLGILWSFLNPLLTMGIQYFIFSTLFGNQSIDNYPVYLLIGVIMFSLTNEACTSSVTAITGNAHLINKVYVPKFIYTLSRITSALINFLLSMIPLFIIMSITGIVPHFTQLTIVVDIVLLVIFLFGFSLILSSLNVFFRDVQFLWGIFCMLWMYGTPIFYDSSLISNEIVKNILSFNPLYHYLTFARCALKDCVGPNLTTVLICLGFSLGFMGLGYLIYQKTKDKFILYI